MSVESKIDSALLSFGYPVKADYYDGAETTYFVFNHNDIPDDWGDDKPHLDKNLIQIHLFHPHGWNSVTLRKQVKQALAQAGFSWPSLTDAAEESSAHWVFETDNLEAVDYGSV